MKPDKKAVGQRIKNLRLQKGLTLEEFGAIFGASKSNVYSWQSGAALPNKQRLAQIAEMADVTVQELLFGTKKEIIINFFYQSWHKHAQNDFKDILDKSAPELKPKYAEALDNFIKIAEKSITIEELALSRYFRRTIKYLNDPNLISQLTAAVTQVMATAYRIDGDKEHYFKTIDIIESFFTKLAELDGNDSTRVKNEIIIEALRGKFKDNT